MKFWLILSGLVLCAFANEENGREETAEKKPGQKRGYGGYPGYDASGYAPPKKYGYQPHKSYGYQPPKTYGYHQSHSDYGYQPHTNYGVKKPEVFGFTYNDGHIDHTINKVTQYANAQDAYKSQQLNVKVDWDIQPENYGYVSKYYGAIPQTVGSIYAGYGGYLNPYGFGTPNPYGYGAPNTYGYGAPNTYGYGAPNTYGYGAPNPYGYGAPNPYGYEAHKPYGGNKESKPENNSEEFEHHWGDPHE